MPFQEDTSELWAKMYYGEEVNFKREEFDANIPRCTSTNLNKWLIFSHIQLSRMGFAFEGKGRCQKKNVFIWDFFSKLWVGGSRSRSKVPNFLVKISIQLFLLQTSRNVLKHVIHKWGGHIWPFHDALRPQRFWNLVRKISHFFKKIKCSKQPKKQNKLNFYFSLSGVRCLGQSPK